MRTETEQTCYTEYDALSGTVRKLCKENTEKDSEIARLQRLYEIERKEKERAQAMMAECEAQIEALKREVARLNGILAMDGTNSGTPISKTPINKELKLRSCKFATFYSKRPYVSLETVRHVAHLAT